MDLVNSYKVTTAAFTTKVASMIALHPGATSLWTGILSWDTNRLESSRAVADGYLAVKAKFKGVSATDALNNPTHPQLPGYVRNIFECVLDKDAIILILDHMQAIALWEFKFLTVAPLPVVRAVLHLDRYNMTRFPWMTCTIKKGSCKTHNHKWIDDRTGPDSDELTRGLDDSVIDSIFLHPGTRDLEARGSRLDALVKLKKAIETENEDEEVDSSDEGVPLIIPQKNTRSGKRKRDEKDSDSDDADERRRKDYELRDEYKESEEGRAKHWVQQVRFRFSPIFRVFS
ncbi:hypothetical protein DFH11DRAFT_84501 [Phellopilus nigrolimitatus]|nr:hypothetical protein DFH11DRAFT_84501 [Phellopilus nigrolimitatus]